MMVLDGSGLLKSCDVKGHAGAGKRGYDIVCAAVSVLVRTAQATLAGREGISAAFKAEKRGSFYLEVAAQNSEGEKFLAGVSAFLAEGLRSVAGEYPENCELTIIKEQK